jgi:hypothetical protein
MMEGPYFRDLLRRMGTIPTNGGTWFPLVKVTLAQKIGSVLVDQTLVSG